MTAPLQVLVVGFEQPVFSGGVLAELARLRDAGLVRLLDVLVANRRHDGSFETLDDVTSSTGFSGRILTALLGDDDSPARIDVIDLAGTPTWSLSDAVPAGATVVIGLIEHLWARNLVDAIAAAGGRPLEEAWLAPDDRALVEELLATSR